MTESYLKQRLIQGLQERGYTLQERLSKSEHGGPSGAIVFRGEREGKPVALKIASYGFLNSFEDDAVEKLEDFRRREKEVLQLAGNHPNIPNYIDSFTINGDERSEPIYVLAMQYLDLKSIADRIKGRERVSEREAQILLRDGLSGLNHLHTGLPYQVLHRDIKPSNVLLNGEKAYIFDFDIVKQGDNDITSSTSIDTVGYYPIDAFSGHQNPGQDLVALGNVAIAGILSDEIRNIRFEQGKYGLEPVRVDGLPLSKKLRDYLGRMTSSPEQRFQTAKEALEGLERIVDLPARVEPERKEAKESNKITKTESGLPEVIDDGRGTLTIDDVSIPGRKSVYETLQYIRNWANDPIYNLKGWIKPSFLEKATLAYLQHVAPQFPILQEALREGGRTLEDAAREKKPSVLRETLKLAKDKFLTSNYNWSPYYKRVRNYTDTRKSLCDLLGVDEENFGYNVGTIVGGCLSIIPVAITSKFLPGLGYLSLVNLPAGAIIGQKIQSGLANHKLKSRAREVDSWIAQAREAINPKPRGLEEKVGDVNIDLTEDEERKILNGLPKKLGYYIVGASIPLGIALGGILNGSEGAFTGFWIGNLASFSSIPIALSTDYILRHRALKQKRLAAGLDEDGMREYVRFRISEDAKPKNKDAKSRIGLKKKPFRRQLIGSGIKVKYTPLIHGWERQVIIYAKPRKEEKVREIYNDMKNQYSLRDVKLNFSELALPNPQPRNTGPMADNAESLD